MSRMMLRAFALIAFTLAAAQGVQAQGFLHKIKDKVKDKAGQRVDNQTDKAIDKGLDKTEGAITCVATDAKCVSDAKAQGKSVVVTDASGKPVSSADSAKAVAAAGGQGAAGAAAAPPTVNLNADFVPGTRTLFEENFAGDPVGDLPLHVKVKSGNWEIAQIGSRKVLRSGSGGRIMIPLPETLPDKFTLQIELQHSWGWSTDVWFVPDSLHDGHERVEFGSTSGIGDFSSAAPEDKSNKLYLARMMVDGGHAKVYIEGKRVANVPEAKLGRSNGIWISATGSDEEPFILYDIRIAASQTSLFDALNASGRVATHGILFATNSATIEPGSDSTLKEIGDMLTQHADLKLMIEGHTDNVGSAAANQTLSEQRAAAVKTYLVTTYHVDAGRLQTKGYGDTKPVASNSTPDGRQQNRRVELVKM